MILGPDDPRAITGPELAEARKNTERWNALLGLPTPTAAQQKAYEKELDAILDLIGWSEDEGCPNCGRVLGTSNDVLTCDNCGWTP